MAREISFPKTFITVFPNRGGIRPWGGKSWVHQGRNFHFIVKLPIHCVVLFFLIDIGCLNELYHYIFVSYLVD